MRRPRDYKTPSPVGSHSKPERKVNSPANVRKPEVKDQHSDLEGTELPEFKFDPSFRHYPSKVVGKALIHCLDNMHRNNPLHPILYRALGCLANFSQGIYTNQFFEIVD